ncbi:PREDICTED: L-aminoadipate-semialdehyde dehydrogenase-phosphopantetheinyl transferase-like [Fragaria vesca subsp. vesca]|uniref:L-aminoadipate-semialdehyde dehydrogenase-phosphopantetheinyl transferase-like n=1 Tax=Fragaria vesca subsp. vesca TaxID=101020 RepID=UPI0002C3624C|nr:PREDICTED: L-aminoadipate-semialdehyde dehydrogenase-phosphopantetheinyl transferase-like [Fragaria vesca subsp. vesca]XP_011469323.1 PREDICTED: L-aminoadipate-semialdehyde dehydrogenase-phosphopantetheinyl transferase-like [Fragaria vesca subsp. vesca]XP_011469324.1 PREDICTED: L-aminoadipate-semialdehyde dehydrogenase-phosphopantetheinyl transferase-like [Fragaria vesca subsp. vesca]XP_011469325.1 PREDICTED: L-aminoadipate-semialdehyde dehydrogenase-phosphopantetheinyl transferase-like [Frag
MERWVVDISEWDPSPEDLTFSLSLLPPSDQSSVTRFVRVEDRKRALVSRLLQYALVLEVLAIPYHQLVINRTLEGKPYLECGDICLDFPNFNFNVSHHGDYVAIASEPLCLVGVDIVSIVIPQAETVPEFLQSFSSYFSSFEWHNICTAGTTHDMLIEFYRYWCLKEAFVKATGSGLVDNLYKVEFHHSCWENISVNIEGKATREWRFWLLELGKNHLVSVARGHPKLASASYKRTLRQTEFDEKEYLAALHLPNVGFVSRTVEQLISSFTQRTSTAHREVY